MTTVDDRIVSMQFDNAEFEKRLSTTLLSIEKLQKSLLLSEGAKGFQNVTAAANALDLSHMSNAVDNISSHFSAMGATAFSIINNITTSVFDFVKKVGGDILSPILTGGKTRAENIAQAKFMFQGLGIDVDKGMASALAAVQGTAFGLDEAAKAAAQFGASGIMVGDQMTGALRGVAGAAAMTGKSFTEIADIFAGSAGTGRVTNQDLMQFATRGLNAAAAVSKVMGITEAQVHEMATEGTLDFKTFADAMDKAFGAHATEANKTYAGSLANLHAAMSRLGATFFGERDIQQRDFFNALTPVVDKLSAALQPLIKEFLAIRRVGIDQAIGFLGNLNFKNPIAEISNFAEGIHSLYIQIVGVASIIGSAFREIFPASSTSGLLKFSEAFKKFFDDFKIGVTTLDNFRSIFAGVFAIFDIAKTVVVEFAKFVGRLFEAFVPAGKGLLGLSAGAGDFAVRLDKILVAGGGIHKFFEKLGDVMLAPIKYIKELAGAIDDFFSKGGVGGDVVVGTLDRVSDRTKGLETSWKRMTEHLQGVFNVLDKIGSAIANWFSDLGQKIADAFKPGDFNSALDVINISLIGSLAILFKKLLSGQLKVDLTGGVLGKLRVAFSQLTSTLKAMQLQLKAEALLKIAAAIGIMTLSLIALSLIDSDKLTKALTAMAVGFGQLVGTMTALDKLIGSGSAVKIGVLSVALIAIATAIDILAIAIKALSDLSLGELAKGLVGVGIGLGILVGGISLLGSDTAGLVAAGVGMIAISVGLRILANAMQAFATMSWGDIAKGLVGVAAGLAIIVTAMNAMPPSGVLSGLGFIEVSAGLLILSQAVQSFGSISWGDMAKGLVGIAGGLAVIAIGMNLMPISLPITATGVLILSAALLVMSKAVQSMGNIPFGDMAKGIGAFAVMLGVLSIAMTVMTGTAAGAVSLLVVSAALLVLTKVLEELGKLSIAQLATSIGAVAASMAVLGIAANLLTPLTPALLSMGAALTLVSTAFVLFGAGAWLVAKAFDALSQTGDKGAKALVDIMKTILTAIPDLGKAMADSILSTAEEIIKALPLLTRLIEAVLVQLLDTVIKVAPKIAEAIAVIVVQGLKLIRDHFPDIVQTGIDMLITLLSGLAQNMTKIADAGAQLVVSFLQGISDHIGDIISAAGGVVLAVIIGIVNLDQQIIDTGFYLLTQFLLGISNNITKVADAVGTIIANFIIAVGDNATKIADAGADALVHFLGGINTNVQHIADKGLEVAVSLVSAIANGVLSATNEMSRVLVNFINGFGDAIIQNGAALRAAGRHLAAAILDGMSGGLLSRLGLVKVSDASSNVGQTAVDAINQQIDAHSPSRVFTEIGRNMVRGLVIGLKDDSNSMFASQNLADKVITNFQSTLSKIPDHLSHLDEFNPTITPVLDLTQVKQGAKGISGFMTDGTITPNVSIDKANLIAASSTTQTAIDAATTSTSPSQVMFEQNIYAPKALSANDIYRSTKSQIAIAKEELGVS